jgi:hypothetical protein
MQTPDERLIERIRAGFDPDLTDAQRLVALIRSGDLLHVDEIGDRLRAIAAGGDDLPEGVALLGEVVQ